jgi:hypothetical protein
MERAALDGITVKARQALLYVGHLRSVDKVNDCQRGRASDRRVVIAALARRAVDAVVVVVVVIDVDDPITTTTTRTTGLWISAAQHYRPL